MYETPGHTYGTASFSFTMQDSAKSWRAVTVGGLGSLRAGAVERLAIETQKAR